MRRPSELAVPAARRGRRRRTGNLPTSRRQRTGIVERLARALDIAGVRRRVARCRMVTWAAFCGRVGMQWTQPYRA